MKPVSLVAVRMDFYNRAYARQLNERLKCPLLRGQFNGLAILGLRGR